MCGNRRGVDSIVDTIHIRRQAVAKLTPQQQERVLSVLSFDKGNAMTQEQIEAQVPSILPEIVWAGLTRPWFRSEVGTVLTPDGPL